MKPLGPPPRIFGMKITSNRIEAFFVLFATVVLFLIFSVNNFNKTSQVILSLGIAWVLYLWFIKKPERPYQLKNLMLQDKCFVKIHKLIFGGVLKRSTRADCKSAGPAFAGSNPAPSKINSTRVWYNGRTSAFQADDAGSIPATRSNPYK